MSEGVMWSPAENRICRVSVKNLDLTGESGGQLGGALTPLAVGMILDRYNWNGAFSISGALLRIVPRRSRHN
jgi:hypothetical protein